jgi:hypothetical protein
MAISHLDSYFYSLDVVRYSIDMDDERRDLLLLTLEVWVINQSIIFCCDISNAMIRGSVEKGSSLALIATEYLQHSFNIFLNNFLSSSVSRLSANPLHDSIFFVMISFSENRLN